MTENHQELEERIGYAFRNPELLHTALIHSSYVNEHGLTRLACNERLEFLGDAVLELLSSEHLYFSLPDSPEGQLTTRRASMVCEPTLAICASRIGLGDFLYLGKGEEAGGGRTRASITSDALEALIGAVYLDGGFSRAKEVVERLVLTGIEEAELFRDSKTRLQEYAQARGLELTYRIVSVTGPAHHTVYTAEALLSGDLVGAGEGSSKKNAEQQAAFEALKKLKEQDT